MRDTERRYAQELLAAAQEGRAPSPEAQAYQDERATLEAVRPFHQIEACVHGLIESMDAGHLSGADARAHFDQIIQLHTETHLAKQKIEALKRR